MFRIWSTAGLLLVIATATSHAQFPDPSRFKPQIKSEAIGAVEGMRQGLESVVRAASQSSSSSGFSSPLVDSQTAQSMSYDNQLKATNTYYQNRKLSREYRAAERGPRHTQEEYQQWAKDKAPDRLNSSQIDRYTGRINWPVVLRGNAYARHRSQVDQLYASHTAAGGGMNTAQYASISRLTQEMQALLKKDVKNITPEQYSYTRKFLEGLRYDARHPT